MSSWFAGYERDFNAGRKARNHLIRRLEREFQRRTNGSRAAVDHKTQFHFCASNVKPKRKNGKEKNTLCLFVEDSGKWERPPNNAALQNMTHWIDIRFLTQGFLACENNETNIQHGKERDQEKKKVEEMRFTRLDCLPKVRNQLNRHQLSHRHKTPPALSSNVKKSDVRENHAEMTMGCSILCSSISMQQVG
ncbi:hypothetical protein AVEN_243339-1 [Araneus ventricosus]|uniref:Uncharacterized protein n=1 Tax=Araneus ventricosus TaxID=182803 RepID=A0A4Y2HBD8_ARAVE|nr:hypothetical protein AVEN_243339-1 [Araneus ventricosus]